MAGDLYALYRASPEIVWGPAGAVILRQLLDRLASDPRSLWRAKQLGDDRFVCWDPTLEVVTLLSDQVQYLTAVVAAVGSGKRPKKPHPLPRPQARRPRAQRLTDFDWAGLARLA